MTDKKMLIIDDMEVTHIILGEMFKGEYQVLFANDGLEGEKIIAENAEEIQIILLDLFMPQKDGFQLLKQIKSNQKTSSIPVIIITADSKMESEIKALDLGAEDYVQKPFEPAIVKRRVKNAVLRRRMTDLEKENDRLKLEKNEEEVYKAIAKQTNMQVFFWQRYGRAFFIGDKSSSFTIFNHGFDGENISSNVENDIHPDDYRTLREYMQRVANQNGESEITARFLREDGQYRWCRMTLNLEYANGQLIKIIGSLTDVDARIKVQNELKWHAEYDSLTRVYNHAAFVENAEKSIKNKPYCQWAVVRIDVKYFKNINDNYGKAEGDRILKIVSGAISHCCIGKGTASRFSGDVFDAFICFETREDIIEFIQKVKHTIAKREKNIVIKPYFGVYHLKNKLTDIDTACDRANLALRSIKGSAIESYAFFDEAMEDEEKNRLIVEKNRLIVESEMERALHEGQFEIYLQPKCVIETGRIVGAEALVRWLHPTKGVMSPDSFIPVFEQNGFIIKLDEYVWNKTAKLLEKWSAQGINIPISVNVSRVHSLNNNFYPAIKKIYDNYKFMPQLLEFELTESAFAQNTQRLFNTLREITKLGFALSVDDFGSGYSSLNVLKDAPVSVIKLDKTFTGNEILKNTGKIVVKHIVEMASDLNLLVIAEGVETQLEANILSSIGCNLAQGYLFAKPMTVESFENLMAEGAAL